MEFHIAPGQDISVPIHFRPKSPGRYMGILEIRVNQPQMMPQINPMMNPRMMGGQISPQFPPQYQNPTTNQEQVFTINLIGSAIAPKIQIGDGTGEFEIAKGKNTISLSNLCNHDLPLIIEIDRHFDLLVKAAHTNQLVIEKQSKIDVQISANGNFQQTAKLKVYFDGKEKTILDWCSIKCKAPSQAFH